MLSTFSSYDDEARSKFAGACYYVFSNSVFTAREMPHPTFAQVLNQPVNFTQDGSEKPLELNDENVTQPMKRTVSPDDRVFFEQKVLALPAKDLWDRNGQLSDEGKQLLARLGAYVRQDPCAVLISFPPNGESGAAHIGAAYRAERAHAILKHLAEVEQISPDQLGIYQPSAAQSNPYAGKAIIEITLRNGGIFR